MNNPDYAVQFGETVDMGRDGGPVAFPFVYSFVNRDNDNWTPNQADPTANFGVLVNAGATVDHYVRLDPDYMFRLLWIKYSVYYWTGSTWLWYEPVLAGGNMLLEYDYQSVIGTKLERSVRIGVMAHGPDGRYVYGGKNLENMINGLGDTLGLNLSEIQGYEYGCGQLRTPYLLPREGVLQFHIVNSHSVKNLNVDAAIYGLKVRL